VAAVVEPKRQHPSLGRAAVAVQVVIGRQLAENLLVVVLLQNRHFSSVV
jgi:hypothetical protein